MPELPRSPASGPPSPTAHGITANPSVVPPPPAESSSFRSCAPTLLSFRLAVLDDPEDELDGTLDAELRTDGLHFWRWGRHFFVPLGARAEHKRGSCFLVELKGRIVHLAVRGFFTRKTLLAQDICSFLTRSGGAFALWQNRVSLPLLALCLAPIAAAGLAVFLDLPSLGRPHWLTGTWLAVGLVCAAVCLRFSWTRRSSLRGVLALNASFAVLLPLAAAMEPVLPAPTIPQSAWISHPLIRGWKGAIALPGTLAIDPDRPDAKIGVWCKIERQREGLHFALRHDVDAGWDETLASADEMLTRLEGRLLEQFSDAIVKATRDVEQDGWLGREWLLHAPGKTILARCFVDRDESVLLVVSGRRLRADSWNSRRFFDSVRLPVVKKDEQGRIRRGPYRALQNGRISRALVLRFTNDGLSLVGVDPKGLVKVWNVHTCRRVRTLRVQPPRWADAMRCAAVSPDGRTVAIGYRPGGMVLLDSRTGKPYPPLPGTGDPLASVTALAFSPDGRTLYQGDCYGGIAAWDLRDRQRRQFPRYGNRAIDRLVVAPDNKTLASVTCFHPQVLSLPACVPLPGWRDSCLRPLGESPLGATYSPDARWLATTTHAGEVCLWDTRSFAAVRTMTARRVSCKTLAFNRDGRFLVGGDDQGQQLCVWDVNTGWPRAVLAGPLPPPRKPVRPGEEVGILSLQFSPDDRLLAVGHDRGAFLVEMTDLHNRN